MTAKRFTLRVHPKDNGVKIFDDGADEGYRRLFDVHYVDYESAKLLRARLEPVVELLNHFHEENEDRFNEQMYLQKQLHNTQKELEPIRKICKKYRIPIKDLPEILEEYIAYDNDDNW